MSAAAAVSQPASASRFEPPKPFILHNRRDNGARSLWRIRNGCENAASPSDCRLARRRAARGCAGAGRRCAALPTRRCLRPQPAARRQRPRSRKTSRPQGSADDLLGKGEQHAAAARAAGQAPAVRPGRDAACPSRRWSRRPRRPSSTSTPRSRCRRARPSPAIRSSSSSSAARRRRAHAVLARLRRARRPERHRRHQLPRHPRRRRGEGRDCPTAASSPARCCSRTSRSIWPC